MPTRARSGRWIRRENTITVLGLGGEAVGMVDRELAELETSLRPVLRRASTGTAVRDLQTRLRALGFDPGPVDGIFGSGTDGAVRSFQQSRRLTVDGIVGPQTWSALDSGSGAQPTVPAPPAPWMPGDAGPASLQTILGAMTRKRYVIFTQPYQLNIVGVRSVSPQPNSFDDSINVFFKDSRGNWTFKSNRATTDPGSYYLHNPMNVSGTAIVVPGQYRDSHKIGLHRSSYTALVQQGPITIIRDANKDDRLDFTGGTPITGVFGINIHRASATGTSSVVDQFSAGCQVFASSSDFALFMQWCQRHSEMYGNSFTYTLLDELDLDK